MEKIVKPSRVCGRIVANASKSYAQRALVANFLGGGVGVVENVGDSDDAREIGVALKALRGGANAVCIGESGLATRLLTPLVGVLGREVTINGVGTILKRSMGDMVKDLRGMGLSVVCEGDRLPITVSGSFGGGDIFVDGAGGSQFLSGLLFALPLCECDTNLHVKDLKSKPYIDMTLEVLEAFGVKVENCNYELFKIKGGQTYSGCDYVVEGDWSGVSTILVAGAVCGSVRVGGLKRGSVQADAAMVGVLESVGAKVDWVDGDLVVERGELRGFEFDASDCPDLFCALVALAVSCEGESRIKGVGRLRNKESDRAEALTTEFGKMGAKITLQGDYMVIVGGTLNGAVIDSRNDHRIAMATAVGALNATGKTTILNAQCVAKSYARFFEDLSNICCYE